jgi:hypothetical protein
MELVKHLSRHRRRLASHNWNLHLYFLRFWLLLDREFTPFVSRRAIFTILHTALRYNLARHALPLLGVIDLI